MSEIQNIGEEKMTDYQFRCYKELRDQQEEELRKENGALQKRCEALICELDTLRKEIQLK